MENEHRARTVDSKVKKEVSKISDDSRFSVTILRVESSVGYDMYFVFLATSERI